MITLGTANINDTMHTGYTPVTGSLAAAARQLRLHHLSILQDQVMEAVVVGVHSIVHKWLLQTDIH